MKYSKETKNLSVVDISKLSEVDYPTIYKVLKEHLGYVSNRLVKQEKTNEPKQIKFRIRKISCKLPFFQYYRTNCKLFV